MSFLNIDADRFAANFTREPFLIGHRLVDHPLFEMNRLLRLCRQLPASQVEYNAGDVPRTLDHSETPMTGLSAEETVRRIAECRSWMVMKRVETDPAYKELLDACLDEIAPMSDPIVPGMCQRQAFIFITSPGSVTPYHIDPEHNFLLQVRGPKHVTMFDGRDREIVGEQELEQLYLDSGRNLSFDESWEEKAWKFTIQPGEGLHFPVTYPHYVQNGAAVSVSFSITFRTPELDRRRTLYRMNGKLRERGWLPKPVGQNTIRDALFFGGARIARRAQSLLGRPAAD